MSTTMPGSDGKYQLPKIPYDYAALEPYIDAKTMEIHHTKHHQAYIDKLNAVLEKYPILAQKPLEELLETLESLDLPEIDSNTIRNHGGGHANHTFFWQLLDPANKQNEQLTGEIVTTFGSVEEFKKQFTEAAVKVFGSGWAWLVRGKDGKLTIYGKPNQDSPYMYGDTPLIGLDVWEHAYYLKYQNRRPEYIAAWWSILKLI